MLLKMRAKKTMCAHQNTQDWIAIIILLLDYWQSIFKRKLSVCIGIHAILLIVELAPSTEDEDAGMSKTWN